ncbi:unnamed protein product [Danaus chrysippus]|uniref:(African queen) hypothetical protein n=1 Tax=Danaus chrysippus TaxID=151541 RepID=A0A8J2QP46_9NEOP|nr:unnamed protein product [Danaus chrysippus]
MYDRGFVEGWGVRTIERREGARREGAGVRAEGAGGAPTRAAAGQRTFVSAVMRPPARAARARFNLPQRDRR